MTLHEALIRNPYNPSIGKIGAYIRYLRYNVDGWYERESKDIKEELFTKHILKR